MVNKEDRHKPLQKLDPYYVAGILDTLKGEAKPMKDIYYGVGCSYRTVTTYTKILSEKGFLKPEVGEGSNNQYIVLYRMAEKGHAFHDKLTEVLETMNLQKDGSL